MNIMKFNNICASENVQKTISIKLISSYNIIYILILRGIKKLLKKFRVRCVVHQA